MTEKHKQPIPANRQIVRPDRNVVSKYTLVSEFLSQPRICRLIGSAGLVYFRLLLVENGIWTSTSYSQIGMELGVSERTAEDWVKHLVENKILEVENKNEQIELHLLGEHLLVANAPPTIEAQNFKRKSKETGGDNPHLSEHENNDEIESPYLSTKQAAKYMNRSVSWMLHRKDIPYFRGKSNWYLRKDLDGYMSKHRRYEPKIA